MTITTLMTALSDVARDITRVAVSADPNGRRASVRTSAGLIRPMVTRSGPAHVEVSLVAQGALLLCGDAVRIEIEVGSATSLTITEAAGTVAYDMRGGSATWDLRIRLSEKAKLIWHGEPFVVSEGAVVRRSTTIDLAADAVCLIREAIVLGREGERPGSMANATRANVEGAAALVEQADLSAASQVAGLLGRNRVVESIIALGAITDLGADCPERLTLEHGGALWRRLSTSAHTASLEGLWNQLLSRSAAGLTPP